MVLQDGASMDKAVRSSKGRFALLALILTTAMLCFIAYFLYPSVSRWASADRSVESARLRYGKVTRGDLLRDVSVQGRIVAADHPTLVSPAQGVVSLLVKEGDVVRVGETMARIESPELQNRLDQERSTLQSKRSELNRMEIANRQANLQNQQEVSLLEVKLKASQRAMERARELFEAGLGSSIDYQKAMDDLEVAGLELDHARRKATLAEETLDFELQTKTLEQQRQELIVEDLERKVTELAVLSTVNGLVSRIDLKNKDTVQPNQVLFSVVDLSEFEVEVLIPESYADEIGAGTPASIQFEGNQYPGKVKSLSPEVENSQVKGIVIFTAEAPDSLIQNMRVSTRLILDSRTDVIKVPRGPFLESMGGRQVYVVEEGVLQLRPITVGAISVTEIEVTSGLSEGQEIVLTDLARFDGIRRILLR